MSDEGDVSAQWAPEWYGQQLKERRERVGLTQGELAKLADVHRGTIRNAEAGRPMELRTHTNIRRILGLSPHPKSRPPRDTDPTTEVLSPESARAAARALLGLRGPQANFVVSHYLGIVADIPSGRLHEVQWRQLEKEVADRMPRAEAKALLDEVRSQVTIYKTDPPPTRYETSHSEYEARREEDRAFIRRSQEKREKFAAEQREREQRNLEALLGDDAGNAVAVAGLEAGVPRPVMTLILQADLDDETKMSLMSHAGMRISQVMDSLVSETRMLIQQMKR